MGPHILGPDHTCKPRAWKPENHMHLHAEEGYQTRNQDPCRNAEAELGPGAVKAIG